MGSLPNYDWTDPLGLKDALSEEEIMVAENAYESIYDVHALILERRQTGQAFA